MDVGMNNLVENNEQSKYLFLFAIVAVLLGLLFFFKFKDMHQTYTPKTYTIDTVATSYKALPSDFPKEVILENQALYYSNTEKSINGKIPIIVSYTSDKSIIEIGKMYTNYFSQNGWVIMSRSDSSSAVGVRAGKEGHVMLLTVMASVGVKTIVTLQYNK